MLRSILDLGDVWVEEIMIHRKDVLAIDVAQPAAKIVEEVLASPFTRLPLWQDDPDNIVGVLHVKPLLRAVQAANGRDLDQLVVRDIAPPPWFFPDPKNGVQGKSVAVVAVVAGRRHIKKKKHYPY